MAEMTKFGTYLVEKGYFAADFMKKVTARLNEFGDSSPSALARLLVTEFKVSQDTVYEALSKLYAFSSFDIDVESLDQKQIEHTKELLQNFPDDFKKKLFFRKIFPFRVQSTPRETLMVLAVDPTEKLMQEIPIQTPYKRFEVS